MQALRQCDGGRVQCVVMVRDDFWMAVTRFLGELEIELVRAETLPRSICSDPPCREGAGGLWPGFRALPEKARRHEREQQQFVEQAIQGLAQEAR